MTDVLYFAPVEFPDFDQKIRRYSVKPKRHGLHDRLKFLTIELERLLAAHKMRRDWRRARVVGALRTFPVTGGTRDRGDG